MSDDDLDRFNDSDSEPERAAAEPIAGKAKGAGSNANNSNSSPAAAHAGGGGKAAQRRAKKAAAKRARLERRRRERERFPRDGNDGSGSGDDDGSDPDEGVADANGAPRSSNAARVHHGVLNVEGVVVDGKLILLDAKSGAVYSATRRAPDGSHLRVGTWNAQTRAVTRLTREEMEAQINPPTPDGKRRKGRDGDGDEKSAPGDGAGDGDGDGDGDDESAPGDGDGGDGTSLSARMEKPPDEVEHAFDADADDHCETSPEAHAHIVNFLNKTAEALGKTPKTLVIYDPYYCAGGTKRSFAALGFPNVVNENKDFYAVCDRGEVPAHDVLVTNPPYSADHVERCITFAARNLYEHDRPYFLLLPSYCVNKPYYTSALLTGGAEGKRARAARERAEGGTKTKEEEEEETHEEEETQDEETQEETEDGEGFKVHDGGKSRVKKIATRDGGGRRQTLPFYVAPVKRYYYWTPKPLIAARKAQQGVETSGKTRRKKSHVGRLGERTSPFLSFWYCGMGDDLQPEALRWHRKLPRAAVGGYTVARNPNDLPMHVLDEWDPRRKAAVERAKEAGVDGAKPKRYAGFSGHNCGQNMDAGHKKKYKEFQTPAGGKGNWSAGKLGDGGMYKRPAKKRKY